MGLPWNLMVPLVADSVGRCMDNTSLQWPLVVPVVSVLMGLVLMGLAAGRVAAAPAGNGRSGSQPEVPAEAHGLWPVYEQVLKQARHIDLTHTLTPAIPVWQGFGPARFGPAINPGTGQPYTYGADGFEATRYLLSTDQFGTQLDPPAHWAPEYPAIDELPATYAVRPLVVISIVEQVAGDPGYHLQVADIQRWEARHGRIPAGAVVMVRSDWSRAWPDPALASRTVFPGVSLAALKFLHEQRQILFHGHEPLDTDATPTLEGEHWLMHHGYAQAEGVANLDQVAETGCLITIGYPKFQGGLGGYARYIALCPPDWPHGIPVGQVPEAPLPKSERPLRWDAEQGVRIRH
jgi:kynurenine formamidase